MAQKYHNYYDKFVFENDHAFSRCKISASDLPFSLLCSQRLILHSEWAQTEGDERKSYHLLSVEIEALLG